MPLNLEEKKAIVAELGEVVAGAVSAVVAEYRGLTVSQMTQLRQQARANGLYLRVVRNTLARRAIEGTAYACLAETLVGPVVLVISQEEPGSGARLVRDFIKENDAMQVKALAVGSDLYSADQLKAIADLPSRDEAIAQLMSVMQAPVTKLVRTKAELYSRLVRVVGQVRDQKQAS